MMEGERVRRRERKGRKLGRGGWRERRGEVGGGEGEA